MSEIMHFVDVTLTPDTAILASGDVIDATTKIEPIMLRPDSGGEIVSMTLIDEDDQGAAIDVYFAQAAAFNLGTENSAPGISDANARSIIGFVAIATADYKDLGGVRVVCKPNLRMVFGPATQGGIGSTGLYIGVVNGSGTPTYTAAGLKVRLGILEYTTVG